MASNIYITMLAIILKRSHSMKKYFIMVQLLL